MYFYIADLLITINELPHIRFRREGNDLIYTHKLDLKDALSPSAITIETIDHRNILVSLDSIIDSSYKKIIPGEGMPVFKDNPIYLLKKNYEYGNLIIEHQIQ